MAILIISTNPLFKEVIAATVVRIQTELIELSPEDALARLCELRPDVIIIDETIMSPYFEDLLIKARSLQKTRTIVLNTIQNEIILLDFRRATLRKADDLIEAIASCAHKTIAEIDDYKIADIVEAAETIARLLAFLASAFKQPPDASQVAKLRVTGVDASIGLDRVPVWNDDINCGARKISEFIETTAKLSKGRVAQILDTDWSGLFGSARTSNCPEPYEALYLEPGANPDELFSSLVNEYAEECTKILSEENVRPDSIGVELSYLNCLAEQAAAAWEKGDYELARSLEGRGRKFCQEHLGKWAREYLYAALEHAQTSYFKGFIRLSWGVISRLGDMDWPHSVLNGISSYKGLLSEPNNAY